MVSHLESRMPRSITGSARDTIRRVWSFAMRYLRGWNLIILIVILVAVGYAGFMWFEESPAANQLCSTCHEMKPFYDAYMDSPHKQFNCHVCHEFSISLIPQLIGEAIAHLMGPPPPEEIAEVRLHLYEECLKCHHKEDLEKLPLHKIHLKACEIADTCTFCHSTHILKPRNQDCIQCHPMEKMIEVHRGFHSKAAALLVLRNATQILEKLPGDVKEVLLSVAGGEPECYRCHGEHAVWGTPMSSKCYRGIIEGKSCFDCHTSFHEVDITLYSCIECHRK